MSALVATAHGVTEFRTEFLSFVGAEHYLTKLGFKKHGGPIWTDGIWVSACGLIDARLTGGEGEVRVEYTA